MNEEALNVKLDSMDKRITDLENLTQNYKVNTTKLEVLENRIDKIDKNVEKLIEMKNKENEDKIKEVKNLKHEIFKEAIIFLLGGGVVYFIQEVVNSINL